MLSLEENEPMKEKETSGLLTALNQGFFNGFDVCCVKQFILHSGNIGVRMVVADDLAPNRCQDICDHRDDVHHLTANELKLATQSLLSHVV